MQNNDFGVDRAIAAHYYMAQSLDTLACVDPKWCHPSSYVVLVLIRLPHVQIKRFGNCEQNTSTAAFCWFYNPEYTVALIKASKFRVFCLKDMHHFSPHNG